MSEPQLPPKESRVKKPRITLRLMLFIVIVLAVSAIYFVYLWPSHENDPKWYNFSFLPSPDTMMVIVLNSTGPQQVTILNSSSDMATVSMYCAPGPSFYQRNEDGSTSVELRQNYTYNHVKVDTLVYLPRGHNYQVILSGRNLNEDRSKVTNEYGSDNVSIRIDDLKLHGIT
jgi:hypothetical protein